MCRQLGCGDASREVGVLPASVVWRASENEGVAKRYRDVTKTLHRAGWRATRTRGSHEVWRLPDGREVTVPAGGKSNRDVPAGTLAAIRRVTGLDELR